MSRADGLTLAAVMLVAAVLLWMLVFWEAPRYRPDPAILPAAITVIVVTATPDAIPAGPPTPHYTRTPIVYAPERLPSPRPLPTATPTPTIVPTVAPTETPAPARPPVQRG